MLNADGEFIQKIGDVGHDDGTFYYPDGIDYSDGKLVVADKFNDRVEVFNVPRTGVAAFIPAAPWLLMPLLLLAGSDRVAAAAPRPLRADARLRRSHGCRRHSTVPTSRRP